MDEILISIANKITDTSNKRKALSKALSNSGLKHTIEDLNLGNLKICGVDGGFLKKDYHGARIILRRAVAVCFNFKDGSLESCDYLPNTRPFPEPIIVDPEISDQEFGIFSNLKREELELETALKAVYKFKEEKIYTVYIKSVDYDRPLRIDFFSDKEKLNKNTKNITEIIYKISKHNRNYSYPSVLVEADARAKLTEVEIEHFKSALAEKLGNNPTLLELRREGRQL